MTNDEKAFLKKAIQAGGQYITPIRSLGPLGHQAVKPVDQSNSYGVACKRIKPNREKQKTIARRNCERLDSMRIWEKILIVGCFGVLLAIQLIFTV